MPLCRTLFAFNLSRHSIPFPRHPQLRENLQGPLERLLLDIPVALCPSEQPPIPVAVSETSFVAQLQAEDFLLFEEFNRLVASFSAIQDYALVARRPMRFR